MFEEGDFGGKKNMLSLLIIPGEGALRIYALLGNFLPLINLSEQGSSRHNDTACISPGNLSAAVIINEKLDIFSWTRKRTVLRRFNVNAAVWISPAKARRATFSVIVLFFPLEQGSPLWLKARMLCSLLQLLGPEQHSISIWQGNTLHSWTTPLTFPWLMITQVKRKPSEGKMTRPQRMNTQTQSMDEVQEANIHLQGEKSA